MRRSFSLVEVLIAITLIVLIGSGLYINVKKGFRERREKGTIERVQSSLKMASRLAKITHREVKVLFYEDGAKRALCIHPDIGLSRKMKKAISRPQLLEGVREVELHPRAPWNGISEVSYFPWGLNEPKYSLEVQFESGNKVSIDPANYLAQSGPDDARDLTALYPQEVLHDEPEKKVVHTD